MRTRNHIKSPQRSKELKALALKGIRTPQVQGFLLTARGQTTTVVREQIRARVLERMARKAHVEALIRLRNAPKRPGVIYFGTAGLDMGPRKSEVEKEREAAEVALTAEEDRLKKARVLHLEMLRASTMSGRRFGCFLLKPKPKP
ncbi:hypothetical protein C8J57DRAFT_1499992 [Mycena rebaudengoi]|nr:hypothetical protein C8J57DRAFT_1499992 [Mycena rebaudengoi]